MSHGTPESDGVLLSDLHESVLETAVTDEFRIYAAVEREVDVLEEDSPHILGNGETGFCRIDRDAVFAGGERDFRYVHAGEEALAVQSHRHLVADARYFEIVPASSFNGTPDAIDTQRRGKVVVPLCLHAVLLIEPAAVVGVDALLGRTFAQMENETLLAGEAPRLHLERIVSPGGFAEHKGGIGDGVVGLAQNAVGDFPLALLGDGAHRGIGNTAPKRPAVRCDDGHVLEFGRRQPRV